MGGPSDPIRFAIVGAGARAAHYLRIAAAAPARFVVSSVVARDRDRATGLTGRFGVPTVPDLDELLARDRPTFVVVAVRPVSPGILAELAAVGVPALTETPPAWGLDELDHLCDLERTGARLQVAEQLVNRPMHAARLAIVRSGRLGTVSYAHVSVAHGYHGMSLMRAFLGVEASDATVEARAVTAPLMVVPRSLGIPGEPAAEGQVSSRQVLALVRFGDRTGVYDFSTDQYFSPIRSSHVLIRGDRGEIRDDEVRYLDGGSAIATRLDRVDSGHGDDLGGYHHVGVRVAGEWIARNDFAPARLSDDEIATATCLVAMDRYVRTGVGSCSIREAANDRHLELMIERAIETGERIEVPLRF